MRIASHLAASLCLMFARSGGNDVVVEVTRSSLGSIDAMFA
jgi:hypothetical protein